MCRIFFIEFCFLFSFIPTFICFEGVVNVKDHRWKLKLLHLQSSKGPASCCDLGKCSLSLTLRHT
ncbi:unnamed protein product [Amoebophrya sp. A25]|nr:unnamed protein product [Amoebophrya sp. A25]|eukprot:GSA25T00003762001.1